MKKFTEEFNKIISDPDKLKEMTEGSASLTTDYKIWAEKRGFINEAINDDGSILDIGCANGFFLKSLQEWSDYNLVPYGIDIEKDRIATAKKLFPEYQDHFAVLDAKNINQLTIVGLPKKYDFVYWNFYSQWNIGDKEWKDALEVILSMTRKRLILGFYAKNIFHPESPEWRQEREFVKNRSEDFKKQGFAISGTILNPTNFNQSVAWIDKK